ncbi:polyamine aminopropyltransferase [Arenicella chitinivorans]|uniref:Polyamine aminopropyltransferase n=1 Tax=Arenicella chitinivorans TaxID=1329800 RepID=A0A918RWW2_9GAMM|nr:polyamine aminopropyltransferase [Arenicella chitinivorans]GHA15744.1 polyamine aminopropyltransferase [Arenicella chitinivorans]
MKHFKETLYDAVCQEFRIDKMYFESKTEHQHLMIFHNAQLGRVMTLDGVVQTTEADEFVYHEMLAHVPIFAHGNAKRVLIVGGGDGGMIREVLKHPVEHVTQVEIDQAVVDMAIEYLPNHSDGAYEDPRLNLVIADGFDFVKQYADGDEARFDVIISDSTDPIGPGEVLFTDSFYAYAKRCLNPGGIMVTQNGVPFFQQDEIQTTYQRMGQQFEDMHFYCAPIPTYYGGFMTFAWGTDDLAARTRNVESLRAQFDELNLDTRYYNPEIHLAAFALPQYVKRSFKSEI